MRKFGKEISSFIEKKNQIKKVFLKKSHERNCPSNEGRDKESF